MTGARSERERTDSDGRDEQGDSGERRSGQGRGGEAVECRDEAAPFDRQSILGTGRDVIGHEDEARLPRSRQRDERRVEGAIALDQMREAPGGLSGQVVRRDSLARSSVAVASKVTSPSKTSA